MTATLKIIATARNFNRKLQELAITDLFASEDRSLYGGARKHPIFVNEDNNTISRKAVEKAIKAKGADYNVLLKESSNSESNRGKIGIVSEEIIRPNLIKYFKQYF